MSVFGETYAKYYNLLYKDKNYLEEYTYIREILGKHGANGKNILDIGCGTGKHLHFFKRDGFSVSGVDMSENMISEAKKYLNQEENLICAKASEFQFNKKFDAIVSLFHVMSYQTENNELEKVFLNVSEHLAEGGLFVFDFWYGPAVLSDPPVVRIKRLEDDEIKITRITEPVMRYNENIVDVNFEVLIEDKKTHISERIHETHNMRYLFLPEIDLLAEKHHLEVINSFEWMGFSELSSSSWYAVIVCKKKYG
jgi:SAM-dependent methyltransferase